MRIIRKQSERPGTVGAGFKPARFKPALCQEKRPDAQQTTCIATLTAARLNCQCREILLLLGLGCNPVFPRQHLRILSLKGFEGCEQIPRNGVRPPSLPLAPAGGRLPGQSPPRSSKSCARFPRRRNILPLIPTSAESAPFLPVLFTGCFPICCLSSQCRRRRPLQRGFAGAGKTLPGN